MSSDRTTIQSLRAVDAWIDVINANISGGVRTAYKASRLKFSGSNVDVVRSGTTSNLPLQFPEPGLTTAHTVIDWTPRGHHHQHGAHPSGHPGHGVLHPQ
jgi:hypothetical protein